MLALCNSNSIPSNAKLARYRLLFGSDHSLDVHIGHALSPDESSVPDGVCVVSKNWRS
jgi:hypothetical protein